MTTIRASEPRELLAYLPHCLGFVPHESVVLVSLRPPRRRVGLVARVDIADLTEQGSGHQTARALTSHLGNDGAEAAVAVCYVPEDPRDSGPWRGVVADAVLAVRAAAEPVLGPVPVWVVTPTGYLSYDCDDPRCCPPGGHQLGDLAATQTAATMVLAGSVVADSREERGRIIPADGAARQSARRAAARWERQRADGGGGRGAGGAAGGGGGGGAGGRAGGRELRCGPDAGAADQEPTGRDAALLAWRAASLTCYRTAVAAVPGGAPAGAVGRPGSIPWAAADLGRIGAALADVVVRDAVLVSALPGPSSIADAMLIGKGGDDVARAMGALLRRDAAKAPVPEVLLAHQAVLRAVAAHATLARRAPALALLAVLSWWDGDGAMARMMVDAALRIDEGYTLARLVDQILSAAMPPAWLAHAS